MLDFRNVFFFNADLVWSAVHHCPHECPLGGCLPEVTAFHQEQPEVKVLWEAAVDCAPARRRPGKQQPIDTCPRPVLFYNQMVVDQLGDAELDRLFQALADATRRDIMRRVAGDE